jgi:hypothetical protein
MTTRLICDPPLGREIAFDQKSDYSRVSPIHASSSTPCALIILDFAISASTLCEFVALKN